MTTILNKVFALSLLAFSVSFAQASPWSLNDVTYLFPLPATAEMQPTLIHLNTLSIRDNKALMNPAIYAKILGGFYETMSVVAIRIDPCFRDQFTDKCRRQIRMVWQPLAPFNQKIVSIDVALHTFYDLSDNEFVALMNELQVLKKKFSIVTDKLPLWIHPGFKADHQTDYQKEFIRSILSKIGFNNTSRIAVMRMGMAGRLWEFQSFDVDNGIVRGTTIFDMPDFFQNFMNIAKEGEFESNQSLDTAAKNEHSDQILRVINKSTDPAIRTPEALKLYLGRSIKLEDPNQHLPGTIDCVSCHGATQVKVWAANQLNHMGAKVDLNKKPGRHNYKNMSPLYGPTSNFRALGYILDRVQLSDRTINESAMVADWLNQPPKK